MELGELVVDVEALVQQRQLSKIEHASVENTFLEKRHDDRIGERIHGRDECAVLDSRDESLTLVRLTGEHLLDVLD